MTRNFSMRKYLVVAWPVARWSRST